MTLSLFPTLDKPEPAPPPAPVVPPPSLQRPRWTLGPWEDDGGGMVRFWRAEGEEPKIAACVEPDDVSECWTVTVLRPVGRQGDRVAWWTGGSFYELTPVDPDAPISEADRTVRQADGTLVRVREVPLPHPRTLEAAQDKADRSLEKLARRYGR